MKRSEIRPSRGARRKRKRVGRGSGSGYGTYSGRGSKGQKSRSGGGVRLGFEGGQLPLIKRLPRRRGFTNIFKKEYSIVNVARLNIFPPGAEVTPQELFKAGLIKSLKRPVKVLGGGALQRPLSIKTEEFSAAAEKKIANPASSRQ
jgi:large subunit ribosomal protein L15